MEGIKKYGSSYNEFNSNNIIVYVSSFKYITKCSQVIALQYISNKENEHRKYNLINVKDCKTQITTVDTKIIVNAFWI